MHRIETRKTAPSGILPDGVVLLLSFQRKLESRTRFVRGSGLTCRVMLFYLHPAHGASPPEKMYEIRYTTSEMSTVLS
ncbi:MAG: hypothetical protein NT028_10115, partial [candidate division Zixibacteria bacterium]|nr:hypothetical protein [candidate division Zixibacteria bacterium]